MSEDDLRANTRFAASAASFVAREADEALAKARLTGSAVRILIEARSRAARHRRRQRLLLGMTGVAGVGAFVGLMASRLLAEPPSVLSYTVDGAKPSADGYVYASATREPTVAFSDGTDIHMLSNGRARVLDVGQRGARVLLEEGRAHVRVAHRPGADWQVQAGSYVIHVHGTSFLVAWNAGDARLDVQMESGVVSVDGPRPGETVMLRAGQSLSALAGQPPTLSTAERPAPAAKSSMAEGGVTARPPTESPGEVAGRPAPAQGSAPPAVTQPAASRAAPLAASLAALRPRWAERLVEGDAEGIVAEAQKRGIGVVLATASSGDLAALADAARFRKQDRLAERVLKAQRLRFAGSVRAQEASFLLGRLAEESPAREALALAWYERYLREAPSGVYADEAMGRLMIVLQRQQRNEDARELGAAYLRRFPQGSYARAARAVTSLAP